MPRSKLISKEFVVRLAFEFTVVFAGVSLAFVADSLREGVNQRARADQTYRALEEELGDHVTKGQAVLDEYVAARDEWRESLEDGERPIPWFIPWSMAGPPLDAWDAVLAAGGIDLIDPALFFGLVKYYRMVDWYLVPVDAPDAFVDNDILPYIEEGTERFYGGADLSPKYKAYIDRRDIILAGAQETISHADSLLGVIRAHLSD
jgi:hypothetical protein